ncbi:hypothetical protein [Peterkaempfera sp. SMS 1(5)a]|uniref:hypothetical protein n=1 Tax=Peterkaempfera podocarpi TaxID=3232308 RepID=UPI00366ED42D
MEGSSENKAPASPATDPVESSLHSTEILVEHWLAIDSEINNEVSVEAEKGDPRHVVEMAQAIQRVGWEALPDWPSGSRPDQRVTISLSESQWSLVLAVLEHWAKVADSVGSPGQIEDAQQNRAIAKQLRRALGAPVTSFGGP